MTGAAVAPGHDLQGSGRAAALGALDRLLALGAGLGDFGGALLVDLRVTPAGAPEMVIGASSVLSGNGVPPGTDRSGAPCGLPPG